MRERQRACLHGASLVSDESDLVDAHAFGLAYLDEDVPEAPLIVPEAPLIIDDEDFPLEWSHALLTSET